MLHYITDKSICYLLFKNKKNDNQHKKIRKISLNSFDGKVGDLYTKITRKKTNFLSYNKKI